MSLLEHQVLKRFVPIFDKAINSALAMDPGAEQKLAPLNGCILEVRITNLGQSIFIGTEDNKVLLLSAASSPTVTMASSLIGFAKLAAQKDTTSLLASGELQITGDAVRAQQIYRFTQDLDIDWEGLLAKAVGDTPARLVGNSVRQGRAVAKTFSQNFTKDIEEFIKYELRLLPSRALANKQFDAIDQLRLATDRLESRVRSLTQRIKRG